MSKVADFGNLIFGIGVILAMTSSVFLLIGIFVNLIGGPAK